MLIVTVCVAGGMAYAGIKTFIKYRPKKSAVWLNPTGRQKTRTSRSETDSDRLESRSIRTEKALRRNFAISSVSLGLNAAGVLVYPPLGIVSTPLNIYTSISTFEKAYEFLLRKRRGVTPVVVSVAVVGALVAENYLLASIIDWLYYYFKLLARRIRDLNRYLWGEVTNDGQLLFNPFGGRPHSVWVQVDNIQRETPIEELEVGDVVVVQKGEMMPVDGRVVEGSAVVTRMSLAKPIQRMEVGEGDSINALSVIQSGELSVRVERI